MSWSRQSGDRPGMSFVIEHWLSRPWWRRAKLEAESIGYIGFAFGNPFGIQTRVIRILRSDVEMLEPVRWRLNLHAGHFNQSHLQHAFGSSSGHYRYSRSPAILDALQRLSPAIIWIRWSFGNDQRFNNTCSLMEFTNLSGSGLIKPRGCNGLGWIKSTSIFNIWSKSFMD